ncbi:MAG: TetR/AcrR family transcriptional regulator [Rhizonema sp. PD38]|nr:TetR/AcrR family transcriptional regulator [Rhizonema sp. PD38]
MDRSKAVEKIAKVFRQCGYEGTTLSLISEATGLGRASLYHHFPNGKQEMAAAVLEHAGKWFGENILASLQGEGTPAERIACMGDHLSQFYDYGRSACLLAVFTLGESDQLFHSHVKQMLNAWIDHLTVVLAEISIPAQQARQRAEDAIIQVQGALVLVRVLDSTEPFERIVQQLSVKLLEPIRD